MTLPVLHSALLDLPGVRHAFFTRRGGVSTGLYESLNVGLGSRDDPAAVAENRRRAAEHLNGTLVTAYQIHSPDAVIAEGAWTSGAPEADAVISRTPGVVCGALSADCAPILMVDPEARIVAAAHAGWKGALTGVVEGALAKMESLGARRGRVLAAVGPCISQAPYEVGAEFLDRFVAVDPAYGRFFADGAAADRRQFDLPGFVLDRLEAAGVGDCEWIGADTCADEANFFSNRRAFHRGESDYGRLLSAIVLES